MLDKLWGYGSVFESHEALTYLYSTLTGLGMNPPEKYQRLYFIYAMFMNILIGILTPLAFNLSYFIDRNSMNISQLITSLQAGINVWGIPIKMTTIYLCLYRLRDAKDILNNLDARCTRTEEFAKIRRLVMMGNRIVFGFYLIYYIYSCSTIINSIAYGQPPFALYIPLLNWHNSKWQLCLQVVFETIILGLVIYRQIFDDSYPVVFIYIIRIHMQLLVCRVRRLGSMPEKSSDENYKELIECIENHQCLLELLDLISPVISITVFIQLFITAAILCTTMVNIFVLADSSTQIASVFYFLAVMLQTSPCCYQATLLMTDSDELPLAIFQCYWIQQDVRFRKMLIFFMQRAQQTMSLKALKLFDINLSTSVSIAKFSFSLYTLISKMDFGQAWKN